jgi:cadmium resistance protein CadD (predicted permease)
VVTASLLATAVVAFAGTTIDDVIILAALFATRRAWSRPSAPVIVAGQYLGFGMIMGVSGLAAKTLEIVPQEWIGLLGLVPIGFGAVGLIRARDTRAGPRRPLVSSVTGIATVTFANGADNISVFTPLFRSHGTPDAVTTGALFLILIGVWCVLGAMIGGHPVVIGVVGDISHWLVPVVFITVGTLILISSGTLGAITGAR